MSYNLEPNQGIAWVASGKKKILMLNYFQVISFFLKTYRDTYKISKEITQI